MDISGEEYSWILPAFSLSSVVRGSESHKMIDLSGNPVLRIYYTSRVSISHPSRSSSNMPRPWLSPGPRLGEAQGGTNRPRGDLGERPVS